MITWRVQTFLTSNLLPSSSIFLRITTVKEPWIFRQHVNGVYRLLASLVCAIWFTAIDNLKLFYCWSKAAVIRNNFVIRFFSHFISFDSSDNQFIACIYSINHSPSNVNTIDSYKQFYLMLRKQVVFTTLTTL
jgi:hypothetical protein